MSGISHLTVETGAASTEDLVAEVETCLGGASDDPRYPRVYEHGGNVVATRGFEPEELVGVRTPRVVRTSFNDTVDAGGGTLHERLGDRFVEVDHVSSPVPDRGAYVRDYFRINYGIAARYGYDRTEPPGRTGRGSGRSDWPTVLATDWERVPVAPETLRAWVEAASGGGRADGNGTPDPDPERVAALLEYDGLYRPAAAVLGSLDGPESAAIAESAREDLAADDPDVRDRTVRRLFAVGVEDPDLYRRLLGTVPTVSERTRALVAAHLWDPTPLGTAAVDGALVSSLLSLTDDPVPELRVGAFVGAARTIEALYERATTADPDAEGELEAVAERFFAAYGDLLRDEDPRNRERATRMIHEALGRHGVRPFADGLWLRAAFPVRWRVVRGLEDNFTDDDLGTTERSGAVIPEAFDGEPSAVSALVEYAYRERGPDHREVRTALARFAEAHPTAAVEAVEPAVAAVEDGEVVAADLRLLYALGDERPDRIATVADELAALLDPDPGAEDDTERDPLRDRLACADPEVLRREAARTLNALPAEARPVDRPRLLAALGGATERVYGQTRLVPGWMAALAEADPETGVDRLRESIREAGSDDGEGFPRSTVESAIEATARVAPGVVAEALPEIVALLDRPAAVSTDLALALAATARAHPEAVAGHAPTVGSLVGHHRPAVREAAATALVAASRAGEESLPAPFGALATRGGDAASVEAIDEARDRDHRSVGTAADWPVGVVAGADPVAAAETVVDVLPTDHVRPEDTETLVEISDLLAECALGDAEAAVTVLERVSEDLDPFRRSRAYFELLSVFRERYPDRQWMLVHPAVTMLSSADAHRSVQLDVLELLGDVAAEDPGLVRGAIVAEYGSVRAFVDGEAGDVVARRGLAERVSDREFETWYSELVETLERRLDTDGEE